MIQQAIALNNDGVACLASGRFFDAIALARRALQIIKDIRSDEALDDRAVSGSTANTAQINDRDHAKAIRQNETHFVYTRPLMIPANFGSSTTMDQDALLHALTAYITFNLALACHRFGIESGLSGPMQRAVILYRLLLEVSIGHQGDTFGTPAMDFSVMHCLIWNNLACLHFEHCENDDGARCIERMLGLIQAGCLDNASHLTAHEAGEIKLNARFLRCPEFAGAA